MSPSFAATRLMADGGSAALQQHREQFVEADAGLGRDADDRRERPLADGFGRQPIEFLLRWQLAFEVFFHHLFVGLDDRFENRLADARRVDQRADSVLGRIKRRDDSLEFVPLAERHVEQRAAVAKHFADGIDQLREIDLVGVELGDAEDPPQTGVSGFLPGPTGVDPDARVGVDRDQRGVGGPQRADRLADEVRIPGRVDQVEVLAFVIEMDDRRLDRMLVVLLLFVEIADAGAGVDAGLAAHRARLHQQMVDERRLPRGAVPTNRDVADVLDVACRHNSSCQTVELVSGQA